MSPESRPLSILNPHVQQAWEYLSLCAYINRLPIPTHITDFVWWLHQPVEEWSIIGEHCQSLGLSGSILNAQGLSPQFRALAEQVENTYKPHLELEDQFFKDIFEKCWQDNDADSYTGIRTFLLFHPIYDDIYIIDNPSWQSNLNSNLES